MGAGHDHGAGIAPGSGAPDHRGRILIAFVLVLGIAVAQAIGSWMTGSLALLVDTVHALTDSVGLLVALIAALLMSRPPNAQRTWGLRRVEVLAALGQALLLLGVSIYALAEGIERWFSPPEVAAREVLIFGVVGLVCNVVAMLVLSSGRNASLNMRAAFLEVLMDALGTLAVIVSAIVMMTTGFQRADTIAAFAIALMIIPRAWLLMRETTRVLLEYTPKGLDLDAVRRHLLEMEHVVEVHDLHASTVATGLPTLTAHIVLADECFTDGHAMDILAGVQECVAEHFDIPIHHATIQLETAEYGAREAGGVLHP